jgi:hypothetical protein
MTQYLLAVYDTGADAPADDEMQARYRAVDEFNAEVQAAGAWLFAGGLEPADTASTVDGTKGEAVTTEGPLSGSATQIGGFWVIEAPDADAARTWAAKGSAACGNPVEVRPFQGV